jgi:hypothetical protein
MMVGPQFQAKFSGSSQTSGRLWNVEKGIAKSRRSQKREGLPLPSSGLWTQAKTGCRSEADTQ